MNSISLYTERDSIIHHIHPTNKVIYIFASILVPILLPSFAVLLGGALFGLILLLIGKVFKRALPMIGFVFLILLTVIIIQGLFHPTNSVLVFTIGPAAFYQEGLLYGLTITLRVMNIVGAFLILVLTTKPSDLVDSLVRRGLSPRFGYVLNSVFQILPQMMVSMKTIMDAQRSRGLETEGGLRVRIKAFLPLIGPVVLNALTHVKERAMALEVRGFHAEGKKTFLYEEKSYIATKPIQWGIWAVIGLAVIGRLMG